MSSINFKNGTIVPASWLNDVNTVVYTDTGGPGVLPSTAGASHVGANDNQSGKVFTTVQGFINQVFPDIEVSPTYYGADPTGVSNSTDAFATAISKSLNIKVPPGTFLLGPTATWAGTLLYLGTNTGNPSRNGMHFRGSGIGTTTLKLANNAGASVLLFGIGSTDTLTDVTFSDMTIDLNGSNNNINTIYNNAFYFYGKCTNIIFERIKFINMAGQQTIRVGNGSSAGFGDNITVKDCIFENFGIGAGYSTTDISVLFIQANNIKVVNNRFSNNSFVLNTAIGHTACELHGDSSTLVEGNYFQYVQLPVLLDSQYKDNLNTIVTDNTFVQCNYMVGFDTGSTYAQSKVTISDNIWQSTWNNSSSIISIGGSGDASKTREDIVICDNTIAGWGNTNQGLNIIYINSSYLRSIFIDNNDVVGYNGALFYIIGAVKNDGYLDITITNNRMDSLGQTSGDSPSFVDIEPSSGTINGVTFENNKLYNTSAKNYSTKGAIKLSGNINVTNVDANRGFNGIGTTYPILVDSLTSWTTKFVDSAIEEPVLYKAGYFTVATAGTKNLYDFAGFTLNDNAILDIDIWASVGGTSNGSCVSYKVLVASSSAVATLLAHGGTYGTNVTLSFSGTVLQAANSAGVNLSLLMSVRGVSTKPITWLV